MAKNKYGLYVEKTPKKKKVKAHEGLTEIPNARKKINKKEEHNMNTLMRMKGIKWGE